MKQALIECVPNISEGRNRQIIDAIAGVVETVDGVKLLDIDPGQATNRTVITFVGAPEAVVEAAFRLIKKSNELIDMRKHQGEHPRFGATDVCPLIPIAHISMEETAAFAHKLGERVGKELGLSGYFYESAAKSPQRKNLASVRAGEYEGLEQKLAKPEWQVDFGPNTFNPKFGAVAIGARDFLVAYNVNLNTTSTRRANAVAFDVREAGRTQNDPKTGKPMKDEKGELIRIPGKLKAVKAIGWYIEEYGICQISMNLTNINITSVHEAFDAVCESAQARGMRVTGSEIVGLLPKKALLDAGKHYLRKQERSLGVDEAELIKIAVKSMGLDDLAPFDPQQKIIEYKLQSPNESPLVAMSLTDFANQTASESPAPGGGSVSAYLGSLAAALGTMVANLSSHKRGWDERWEYFSQWAEKGQSLKDELLHLVDEDTRAFNEILNAIRLPKNDAQAVQARNEAINVATRYAIEVPFRVMQTSLQCFPLLKEMLQSGLAASASDAAVGALCARAAVMGAYFNVQINCKDFEDKVFVQEKLALAKTIAEQARAQEQEIIDLLSQKIGL
ncbi:MAG: glutamate formimidoyltransferase [Chitinophagales bacterium]|nr:glutamate formimidoyltransferase [Bacteroidota bacterium]MCB9044216.1 glutamate formimidoyltransferase [Chitinophagales bacterium]